MKLFFWQNILSPHQIDFLNKLTRTCSVTLIIENVQDEYRKKDGWEVPENRPINILVNPNDQLINSLFGNKNDIHVFSGISAYPLVYKGFKKAIQNNCHVGILSEPINLSGAKGKLKLLRGILQRLRFSKKIDFIAATGNLGVDTYKTFGYPKNKIFQWGYFVDLKSEWSSEIKKNNNLIFVGNLNHNKQIFPLVKLFVEQNGFKFDSFDILGSGKLSEKIQQYISNNCNDKIKLHGRLSSADTHRIISKSKLLILPSLSDGWGVVVNEALLNGTPVIASSNVGANILLKDGRGDIFQVGNMNQLEELLEDWSNKCLSSKDYEVIKIWANNSISTGVAVKYFLEIMEYTYKDKKEKPKEPWI